MNHLKPDVLKATETTALSPSLVFLVRKVHFLWKKSQDRAPFPNTAIIMCGHVK